jgi:sugar phosphate isomerase/epimerase
MQRRDLLKLGAAAGAMAVTQPVGLLGQEKANPIKQEPAKQSSQQKSDDENPKSEPWLKIAVQQYSFNKQLRSGELKIGDYPKTVVEGTGIKALEYFNGHIEDEKYNDGFFKELRKKCDDLGVVNTMMLCRNKDAVDSPTPEIRKKSIEGYRRWFTATKILGGDYIRVDVRHKGDADVQKKHAVAGLKALCKVAKEYEIGILVENHGNHSGNGAWLADVMGKVNLPNCGTLPDFQNFKEYDKYKGVAEMMPWAKILCAKSKSFDKEGNETNVDFRRMLKIAKDAGFKGYIGIEFEGHDVDPISGIKATHKLINKVVEELA